MISSDRRTFLGGLGGVLAFGLGGLAEGRTRWIGPATSRGGATLDLGRFESLPPETPGKKERPRRRRDPYDPDLGDPLDLGEDRLA